MVFNNCLNEKVKIMKLLTKTIAVVLLLSGFSLYSMEEKFEMPEWFNVVKKNVGKNVQEKFSYGPFFYSPIFGGPQAADQRLEEIKIKVKKTQKEMVDAVKEGELEKLEKLIKDQEHGEWVFSEIVDGKGNNPLHVAIENGKYEVGYFILVNFPKLIGMKNDEGRTPLEHGIAYSLGKPGFTQLMKDMTFLAAEYMKEEKETK